MRKGHYYEDLKIGDECVTPAVTVTEGHILAYAGVSGDFSPLHMDETFAQTSPYGTRIAHGLMGLSLADGLKVQADFFQDGIALGWTWDFLGPIKIGDTLHAKFRIANMRTTRKPEWGIVFVALELINQRDEVIQRGEHRLMIPRRKMAPHS